MTKYTVKAMRPIAPAKTASWAASTRMSRRWQPTQTLRVPHFCQWHGHTHRPHRWQLITSGLPQKTQYMGWASRDRRIGVAPMRRSDEE
jgi:hypothetical protein